jgi:hypothetical protein
VNRAALEARIAELEAQVSVNRGPKPKAPNPEKARRAKFRLEAQKRARLHCSINRYACR